jgi:putative SOS response-associated peptidase YedK
MLHVHITEFTGKKYPKAKHRFALNGAPFMAIAGIWREGQGNRPPALTMLTTMPGPDVESYHNRQVVVLRPENWATWIYLTSLKRNCCDRFRKAR